MQAITVDDKVNCKLAHFKPNTFDRCLYTHNICKNAEWLFNRIKNLDSKVLATKYLQLHHPEWIGCTALHFTASNYDLDAFSILLNRGIDFTIQSDNYLTALHQVIELKKSSLSKKYTLDDSFVHLVLSAHLKDSNFVNPSNNDGLSHFHVACAANRIEVVKGFLDSGLIIDDTVKADCSLFPGFTPLHFTAKYCAFEVAEVLLSCDANMHTKDAKGMTPLHIALETKLKIISENNSEKAVRDKNEKILKLFLENDSNDDMIITDDWGLSHLHVSCTLNDSKIAENYMKKVVNINHAVNMDTPMWPGYTALHFAAFCNIDTVKLLMKRGADISSKDAKGATPFDICIERYKTEDIYAILSLHPIWKNIMLSDGRTKLTDLVFAMRSSSQFEMFLKKLSKNFSIYDSPLWPGCTPMHLAITFAKKLCKSDTENTGEEINLQILRKLCKQNPGMLCIQDVHGHTPLHLAFRLNKKPALDLLCNCLESYFNLVDCVDEDGLSFVHIASAHNNIPLLKRMLSIGVDVNAVYRGKSLVSPRVPSGSTALHLAVVNKSTDLAVELLLKAGADKYAKDANDMTPIHSLLFNCTATILLLSPDLRDCIVSGAGLSHLHIACLLDMLEIVQKLLDEGANVNGLITCKSNARTESNKLSFEIYDGYSPLLLAYENGNSNILKVLLKRGADIFVKNEGQALFYGVIEDVDKNYLDDFVQTLKENVNLQTRLIADTGMTSLHIACLSLDHETIENLLDEGANVNAQISSGSPIFRGYTPLHVVLYVSTEYYVEEAIELLIKRGADVTLVNAASETPIHVANGMFADSQVEIYSHLNTMLEAQRDFSVNPANAAGITHFHIACRVFNVNVVEEFLKNVDINVNQAIDYFHDDVPGYTALHLAATTASELDVDSKQLDTVHLLLKHGANVHAEDVKGDTPLHVCARVDDYTSESLDLFERIARAGADVNAKNLDGNAPLHYYLEANNITLEGIQNLLRIGCRSNTFNTFTGYGYMSEILRELTEEEAQKLFSVMTVNFTRELATDDIGRTVIHNLVSCDQSEFAAIAMATFIEQLAKTGCDVDDQDQLGRSALHVAAKFYNIESISGLLMTGADVNAVDNNGKTAFTCDVDTCTMCEKFDKSISNDRKCKHLRRLETLAIHVKKLQLCGLDVNKKNEDFAFEVFEKLGSKTALSENFFKELETIKNTSIGSQSLTLYDFLSETNAIVQYPRMSWVQRNAVNKFFSPGEVESLRKKFPELAGILQLQFRKARARPPLVEPAGNALIVLVGFHLPVICSDCILMLLSNSELKSLIASTI